MKSEEPKKYIPKTESESPVASIEELLKLDDVSPKYPPKNKYILKD